MISRVLAGAGLGLALLLPRSAVAACEILEQGSIALAERVRDVEVVADLAYLAAGFDGLQIVDVSVPSAPVLLGSLVTPGYAQDVEISGNRAYVAESDFDGEGGLRIVDISNPALPVELGHFDGSFSRVEIVDTLAYTTDPASGLHILFVFNPTQPIEISSLDLAGFETDLQVEGNHAYVSVDGGALGSSVRVVDVTSPASPVEIGSMGTGARLPVAVDLSGSIGTFSAIGAKQRGLILADVSNPFAPVELAFLEQPSARDVRITGDRAYFAYGMDITFAGGPGGLRVIDFTDPALPVEIGSVDTTIDESSSLAVVTKPDGDWVYLSITGASPGLRIFRVADCPEVLALDVIPSSPDNEIPLSVDTQVPVRILGSAGLDVNQISLASLAFGPGAAPYSTEPGYTPSIGDLNADGFDDLLVWFSSSAASFAQHAQQACVDGLLGVQAFVGCDWVSPNQPPAANAWVDPNWAVFPMLATLDATGSFDPEQRPLLYLWEFDDLSTDTNPVVDRFFPDPGTYYATLTVTDDFGQQDVLQVEIGVLEPIAVPVLGALGLLALAAGVLGAGVRRARSRARARPAA